jgi:hypothetical protein
MSCELPIFLQGVGCWLAHGRKFSDDFLNIGPTEINAKIARPVVTVAE